MEPHISLSKSKRSSRYLTLISPNETKSRRKDEKLAKVKLGKDERFNPISYFTI